MKLFSKNKGQNVVQKAGYLLVQYLYELTLLNWEKISPAPSSLFRRDSFHVNMYVHLQICNMVRLHVI